MIDLPPDLLANRFLLTTLIALALLIILAIVAARLQAARRGHAILAVLNESARGQVSMLRGPDAGGFVGSFQPPPEPFVHFVANYRSAAPLDLAGQLLNPLTHHAERLVFVAKLPSRPAAELIWQEGQSPGRALAQRDRSHLWVLRRLDVVNAEYAVRGANTGAIEHVFLDLQTRFRPFLERISVQADTDPECTVTLRLARFNLQELPALVTSLRGLGRAALRS
ncbi:MAG: hypothetical protein U0X20_08470 [Caldilineaceae bacterium]